MKESAARNKINKLLEEAGWIDHAERLEYDRKNDLRFSRAYQLLAISAIRHAVRKGSDRFLLEMYTEKGKTLTSAAIIKLFMLKGNAQRVLFLVDRIELDDQVLVNANKELITRMEQKIQRVLERVWGD